MAFSIWDMSEYWGTGVPPAPLGTSNKMSAPYQAVKARDGYLVMGATNQKLWTKLCQLLQRPDLIDHPEYGTIPLRLKNREALIEELEREFAKRDRSEEHTSELQSLMRTSYAVLCLKKQKHTYI